jgi:hypothetical protein
MLADVAYSHDVSEPVWRADFLLQNRRSALSTPGQLLTPGLVIWLRRTYGVTGDTGL